MSFAIYGILANWGPALRPEEFNEMKLIIWTFYFTQSFFSRDLFRYWSLRYPGVRGLGWQGHTCVKNLPRVGVEVCAKFGGIDPAVRAGKRA